MSGSEKCSPNISALLLSGKFLKQLKKENQFFSVIPLDFLVEMC